MTPYEIVMKSIQTLQERGWCQGGLDNDRGQVCLMGAVVKTVQNTKAYHDIWDDFWMDFNNWVIAKCGVNPVFWNDKPGRTKEEVIALLREYAAEIGEPEKRRVLIPNEVPATPMSPDSPLWTEPTIPEPNPVKVPTHEPA